MAHPQVHDQKSTKPQPPVHIGRPRSSYTIDADVRAWSGDINMSEDRPIKLKRIALEIGLSARYMAEKILKADGMPVSRTTLSLTLGKGYIPGTVPDYKPQIEALLREHHVPEDTLKTIWEPENSAQIVPLGKHPEKPKSQAEQETELLKEAEMLTPTTLKHFRLFRNPFLDDVQEGKDVFMSESHGYAFSAMLDAARNGGFVAVCGECGAGKSVIRRKLISDLTEAADCRVIMPQTIDKTQLSASHILDSIVLDLDPDAKLRQSKEAKARQVQQALLASSRGGMRHVLIIEEAHDLSVPTMKQLKRLWEIEDGYRKVIGIVMIGQQELQIRLNRQTHPEMREVILRCLIASLKPLTKEDCGRYIQLKFNRINHQGTDGIMADDCLDAIMHKLTTRNGYSAVYPLYINNLLAKAMNEAAECGEPLVTAEIIEGV